MEQRVRAASARDDAAMDRVNSSALECPLRQREDGGAHLHGSLEPCSRDCRRGLGDGRERHLHIVSRRMRVRADVVCLANNLLSLLLAVVWHLDAQLDSNAQLAISMLVEITALSTFVSTVNQTVTAALQFDLRE